MMLPRVIPVLLMSQRSLVKTKRFADPRYVGDPVNVISIFSALEVDEIAVLDIDRSKRDAAPDFEWISRIHDDCIVPLSYGGGITTLSEAERILQIGIEKVIINSAFPKNPQLVESAAREFGSQAVIVAIDVAHRGGREVVVTRSGEIEVEGTPEEWGLRAEQAGAGEILLTAIDREGTMLGYDEELIHRVATRLSIPVIAHGGARRRSSLAEAIAAGAQAAAAGSMFVFYGRRQAVLINYPSWDDRVHLLGHFTDQHNEDHS